MFKILTITSLLILSACINSYTCEGDHKETYNNISPTTQQPDTQNASNTPPSQSKH